MIRGRRASKEGIYPASEPQSRRHKLEPASQTKKNTEQAVAVIVVNWNGRNIIESCLRSILTQSHKPISTIVVDNASTDGSDRFISETFSEVRLIRSASNLGFGAGNNLALREVATPYVMLLNNDAELPPETIALLLEAINRSPEYAAAAPKIVLESSPDTVDAAGLVICRDGLAIGRGRMESAQRFDAEEEVFFASGCAALFRREFFEDVGYYDESFFCYGEDQDLGWRARWRGWKCIYVPKALVFHSHSATTGSHSPRKAFLVERNRISVALKNFTLFDLALSFPYTLVRYYWQAVAAFRGLGRAGAYVKERGRFHLFQTLFSAWVAALIELPNVLSARRKVFSNRKVSSKEVRKCFRRFCMFLPGFIGHLHIQRYNRP